MVLSSGRSRNESKHEATLLMFVVICVLPMTCLATPRHPTLARPRRLPRRPPDRFGFIIQVPLSLLSVFRLVPLSPISRGLINGLISNSFHCPPVPHRCVSSSPPPAPLSRMTHAGPSRHPLRPTFIFELCELHCR
ncbi:hypothetical protein IWZ01DRAFT_272400 [Phyllosticta capitalensis]